MSRFVEHKWRPPLMLVLGGSLLAILVLPVISTLVADLLTPYIGRPNAVYIVATSAFLITLVLGWLLWRLILAPVQILAGKARRIRDGDLPTAMEHHGTPEIGDLAQSVLDMAEVLQSRELAVRSYTDHVTHELKTPLTAIRGAAELLEGEDLPESTRKLVQTIAGAERRAEKLLEAAREIAAARTAEHRGTTCLAECIGGLTQEFPGLDIQVFHADITLPLAKTGLEIILTQLANNAAEAGATELRLAAIKNPDNIQLNISDNGPGISSGNAQQIFEPFFTTRRDSGGTGMGLAIVHTMILAHGGMIRLNPSEQGAAFQIEF